jgi:exosortase
MPAISASRFWPLRAAASAARIPPVTGSEAPQRLPTAAKANIAALAILAGALIVHLWPEWTGDPDLSHGFLVPVACVLLLQFSRRTDGRGALRGRTSASLAACLGSAALAGFWVSGLFAANLDWSSALVDFTLAGSFALLLCAAIAAFADGRVALVPFNWASVAAAVIWALSSPIPPGTYTRLTLELQLWVSQSVMRTLDFMGIAAHREGNIIELARGSVGIEEACSGVRSLISCVFAGVLFSAALVRRPWPRVVLIALSAPLALAMNFIRSLFLTLLVNRGVKVEGAWHDTTGYAVLVVTAALLAGIALALDRPEAPANGRAPAPGREPVPGSGRPGALAPQVILSCVLALSGATLAYFAANTRAAPRTPGAVPDLLAILPEAAPGWSVQTDQDLHRFSGTLRTDYLAQRGYARPGAGGGELIILYLAYWPQGRASVGLVESHTPDACWPGSGWVAKDVPDPRVVLDVGGHALPMGQHRLFVNEGYPQHVWFWHLYGGRSIEIRDPYSVGALLRLALRYGFRQEGDQMFVRVSSNRPWNEISGEPLVADFFGRMRGLGLY